MPTPPPWWIDTHVAPLAVFSNAFSSGQSATASEPSCIASVSRFGLATEPESEHLELAMIYQARGLTPELASEVATQLTAHDALGAHARDELGISEITTARPVQAALTSAVTFAVGAAMPLLMVVVSPTDTLIPVVACASLGFLALLGAIGARAGGANILRATARVTFWGALALGVTAGIGRVFGTVI